MTRPPRPKYPSDSKNYHDIRKPGCAHTVRLPEELIEKYVALKNALDSRKSHADVIRFLFEAAEPAIAAVLQQREDHIVIDAEEIPIVEPEIQHDPDEIVDDETFDIDGSECSDVDVAREAVPEVVADSEDDEQSCCMDSQPQQSADSALRVYPDATYGFWGDTTPQVLTKDVQNAAEHWAGNHAVCRTLPGQRKCVVENWEPGRDNKYVEGSETHKAVSDFLRKYLTENKMKFYLRARENFISETFHNVISKYATKRIYFDSSHVARLACAALDWNENIRRQVRVVYNRNANNTAVRRRARTNRVLAPATSTWKNQIAQKVFN
ncbi:hypothetical protein R1sor_007306 [Riccia sorocarpa]|uniref:Transposase n=1 Tax=Riccia sorocarpa TaxID=122646 RepID=A0ABD3HTP7_9MARC